MCFSCWEMCYTAEAFVSFTRPVSPAVSVAGKCVILLKRDE